MNQESNLCIFGLINTGNLASNGEHWMGIVMNKSTNCSGYFDSLENMLRKHFNKVHKTNHKVQSGAHKHVAYIQSTL